MLHDDVEDPAHVMWHMLLEVGSVMRNASRQAVAPTPSCSRLSLSLS
jgi:hypothetical protein